MQIPAILTHPEILGPPLERGARYGHHFVVELISDGKRLWAAASEEGKKVIHEIEHGFSGEQQDTATGSEAVGNQSPTGTEVVTDQANLNIPNQNAEGAAPTTAVGPANTFDS